MASLFIQYSFGNLKILWSLFTIVKSLLKRVSTILSMGFRGLVTRLIEIYLNTWFSCTTKATPSSAFLSKLLLLTNYLYFCILMAGVHSLVAYKTLIGKIELFNKFFCFTLNVSYALLLLTVAPYTYVRYYIFNMGTESFQLFCPAWFVFIPHPSYNLTANPKFWEKRFKKA